MRFVWNARRLCRLTQVETNPLLPPPPASSPRTIKNRCNANVTTKVIDYCFVGEGRGIHSGTRCSSSFFFFFFFPRCIDVPRMLSLASVYIMGSSRGRITDISFSRLSETSSIVGIYIPSAPSNFTFIARNISETEGLRPEKELNESTRDVKKKHPLSNINVNQNKERHHCQMLRTYFGRSDFDPSEKFDWMDSF